MSSITAVRTKSLAPSSYSNFEDENPTPDIPEIQDSNLTVTLHDNVDLDGVNTNQKTDAPEDQSNAKHKTQTPGSQDDQDHHTLDRSDYILAGIIGSWVSVCVGFVLMGCIMGMNNFNANISSVGFPLILLSIAGCLFGCQYKYLHHLEKTTDCKKTLVAKGRFVGNTSYFAGTVLGCLYLEQGQRLGFNEADPTLLLVGIGFFCAWMITFFVTRNVCLKRRE